MAAPLSFSEVDDMDSGVKYNDGWLQILRINDMKRLVNIVKLNPTAYNNDYSLWNFELWFNNMTAMLDEVWFKLDKDEKKNIETLQKAIVNMISNGNVIESKKQSVYPYRHRQVVNRTNWGKLSLLLNEYDHLIRDYMNSKGFGNPDKDDDEDIL